MKTYALILFLHLIGSVVIGQAKLVEKKLYTPKELKEDYLIFRKALETTYPSLSRFTDSVTISKYLDDQYNRLDKPTTALDFYKTNGKRAFPVSILRLSMFYLYTKAVRHLLLCMDVKYAAY